jgi:hypothetical protein
MIIVAGGDSFIYGSELTDCVGGPSKSTFTALLAKDHDYQCFAWPGAGNDTIARLIITRCEQLISEDQAVIVSWTFPGRYDFRFVYDTGQVTKNWYTITPWTNASSSNIQKEFANQNDVVLNHHEKSVARAQQLGIADFADTFYKHVGTSEYWEVYSSLKEIVFLQNYLKANKIPYLFTCADNSLIYNQTVSSNDPVINGLYGQIDFSKWFLFPEGTNPQDTCTPRGFYQWAVENKYPIGTTHPLEEAHQAAAELMQETFNAMVKKHL